jgi:hypothetical protein
MPDDFETEAEMRMLIYDLMRVMYQHGIREVNIGGVMRMLGIANDIAEQHDNEVVILDEKFAKYVDQITEPRNRDQTLH